MQNEIIVKLKEMLTPIDLSSSLVEEIVFHVQYSYQFHRLLRLIWYQITAQCSLDTKVILSF
jgi:hypothetical protein